LVSVLYWRCNGSCATVVGWGHFLKDGLELGASDGCDNGVALGVSDGYEDGFELGASLRALKLLAIHSRPSWNSVRDTIALPIPIPCPRKIPRKPNYAMSANISFTAVVTGIFSPLIEFVCMITSRRDKGFVITT